MSGRLPIRVWLPLGAALFLFPSVQVFLQCQTASDRQVKAAYLYNFAKFVEWPEHAFANSSAAMRFCIWNNPPFEAEVRQIVSGKVLAGRSLEVIGVRSIERLRSCHILFISSPDQRDVRHIIEALREASVLTVGDMKGFIANGGMINFVLEDDRVQFEVNHKSATEVGLRISSRLLAVAKFVSE